MKIFTFEQYDCRTHEWGFSMKYGYPKIWNHIEKHNPKGLVQIQMYGSDADFEAIFLKGSPTGTTMRVPPGKVVRMTENTKYMQIFFTQKLFPSPDAVALATNDTDHYNPTCGVKSYDYVTFGRVPSRQILAGYDFNTRTLTEHNNIVKEVKFDDEGCLEEVILYQPMALVCNSIQEINWIWRPLSQRSGPQRNLACSLLKQAAIQTEPGRFFNNSLSENLQRLIESHQA